MTKKQIYKLLEMPKGTHLILTPTEKGDIDTDITLYSIEKYWTGEDSILYGVTKRCDGYLIPFSWIKSYKVVK